MPTVLPFRLNKPSSRHADCPATEMIRQELHSLTDNKAMIDIVLARMQSFICLLNYDLSLHAEVTDETQQAMLDLVPAVQELQERFHKLITEIIAERILHEVALYYAENPS